MNRLQQAMLNATLANTLDDLEQAAIEVGERAVAEALAEPAPSTRPPTVAECARDDAQRQRDLDAALADAVEIVARQRARLGRRVCSRHDGESVRRIFDALRGMMADGAEHDPSFQ